MIRRGKIQMMFHLQIYIYFPVDTLTKAEPYLNFERLEGHMNYHTMDNRLIEGFMEKGYRQECICLISRYL
jgi:hypothetical protein